MKPTKKQIESDQKIYLRRAESAQAVSISIGTLDHWIEKGIIPTYRPSGRTVLIRKSDLDNILKRFRVDGKTHVQSEEDSHEL